MYFDSWHDLWRVVILGTLAYFALVFLVRVSGKRTLAKWTAFDFVVTIAVGSALATVLLSGQVSLSEGVAALSLLILLQIVLSWLTRRSTWLRKLVKAEPTCLYWQGHFLPEALARERVTEGDVRAAVRGAGIAAMEDVQAVVLEADGSVSVIKKAHSNHASALSDVRRG